MNKYELQQSLINNRITDLNVRVVYYARVSTDTTDQLNSLKNQQLYYENYIKNNPNWTFCGGYIDEGLSGINTQKREKFNEMIDDAQADKFDYIITKEISRFARNTLDSISFTRKLLDCGVGVWFQEDNINTADSEAELRLTIMSGFAQDESRRISRRVKFGHRQAIKNGSVLGNSRMYGYRHKNAKLIIDESEAEMVRLIFSMYAKNEAGLRKIEDTLYEQGYRNRKGGKIDRNVIANIIQNPKYKGYYCGNKVEVIDLFSKQQLFKDEKDWVLWKDEEGTTVPAIVDEEIWELANKIFKVKSNAVKNRRGNQTHRNLFTSKLICVDHNCSFHLKTRQVHGVVDNRWSCKVKLREGADKCNSFSIKESELVKMLNTVLKDYRTNNINLLEEYIKRFESTFNSEANEVQSKLKKLEKENQELVHKKDKLLELALKDLISDTEFKDRNNQFNQQIQDNEAMIASINSNDIDLARESAKEKVKRLSKMLLDETVLIDSKETLDELVDKIYIMTVDKNTMNLEVVLNTGDVKNVVYEKSSSRKTTKSQEENSFSLANMGLTIYTKENMKFKRKSSYGSPNYYNYNIAIKL